MRESVYAVVKKTKRLTAVVTLVANSLYSDEDLFTSCSVKFCCILNPNVIFGSTGLAAVVVVDGKEVVPVNAGGDDVPFTKSDVNIPVRDRLELLHSQITLICNEANLMHQV